MVRVWSLPSGHEMVVRGKEEGVEFHGVRLSPDGKTLATIELALRREPNRWPAHTLSLSDLSTGWRQVVLKAPGEVPLRLSGAVRHVCFGPCGKTLATAHWNGTVKVWSVERLLGRR